MEADESGTLARLKAHRAELIDPAIETNNGRIIKTTGDGMLVEFASVVDAVRCAAEIQRRMARLNTDAADENRIDFRIGINLGDIIVEDDDVYGDGVNIAARLETMADPGGICISGTAHDHLTNKIDVGYQDLGEQTVKNIAKPVRAYRVLLEEGAAGTMARSPARQWRAAAAITLLAIGAGGYWAWDNSRLPTVEAASIDRMAFPLPDKPSIAVLPFRNLTGDPDQDIMIDGLVEDIITSLSNIPNLFVIARNSTFTYKGKAVKVSQVAEELGVRYVLEGSVRLSSDTARVNAQLIDAVAGHHVWAERYDRNMGDFFALQDDISVDVVTAVEVKLVSGEMARIRRGTTSSAEAYGLYLRGVQHYSGSSKEDTALARQLFEEAVELDASFAAAWARLSRVYSLSGSYVRKLVTELSGGVFGYLDSVLERHSFDEFGELI